ncbi:MAG: sugar phosphate isomerase/epimerase [Armatimonadia bacterium]
MVFSTSVHALTEWSQPVKSFREVLREAAGLGYGGIMLMHLPGQEGLTADTDPHSAMIDMEQSDLSAVQAAVREAGLQIACLYQGLMRVADEAQAQQTAAALSRLVDLAVELGTDIVLPNAGAMPAPLMDCCDKEADLQRLVEVVRQVLETAPADIKIAPDIHYQGVLETVADCCRYFELIPDQRAGITLNIGHMTTLRQEGWKLLENYPERVHVVAWKDHLLQPPPEHKHAVYSVELGTGDSPFERYVEVIPENGGQYTHMITLEHVPLEQKPAALGRSLKYMQELFAKRQQATE